MIKIVTLTMGGKALSTEDRKEQNQQMQYTRIVEGRFLERPNRFVAKVEIQGKPETVHVKNTGRCKELLIPGVKVMLAQAQNPNRKTAWDLVAVYKDGFGLINIDSQAPNQVVKEWLSDQGWDVIRPEYTYRDSRVDFYLEKEGKPCLLEVKGCTLEIDGVGYFPDAPTERGVKHIRELMKAKAEGYRAVLAFVIQMEGITEVRPNVDTHPQFGAALEEAIVAGVEVWYLPCKVTEDTLEIRNE